MRIFVITGATGNTGRPLAHTLLDAGHTVHIIARHAEKAADLIAKGAVFFQGDSKDTALLTRAFTGADAAYLMIPFDVATPDYTQSQIEHAKAAVQAIHQSGLKRLVTLSSVGAHLPSGGGVVQGLHEMERMINEIPGINVVHLRATYFLENALGMAGMAKHMGIIGSPVKPDLKVPMVATRDIAAVAARVLQNDNFSGTNIEYILGAKDYTYAEIASIYGKAIGKPGLSYVEFPFDQAARNMVQMGMGKSVVGRLMEFIHSLNEGKILEEVTRTAGNTTQTTAEEFAQTFKYVYDHA